MMNRVLLPALSLACLVFISCQAYAQAVPGCNPAILDAAQKKAQAKVAADVNITEQTIKKPDSVLAMTCFNKAAGMSAQAGGNIFSGDFTSQLAPIIEDGLKAMLDDFPDAAGYGADATADGVLADQYTDTTLTADDSCDGVSALWNEVKDKGVETGTPFMLLDNLINGTMPTGAGKIFQANFTQESTDKIFSDLKQALTSVADGGNYPAPSVPSFSGAKSFCDVLKAVGSAGSGCP